jgi:hypothetical protein
MVGRERGRLWRWGLLAVLAWMLGQGSAEGASRNEGLHWRQGRGKVLIEDSEKRFAFPPLIGKPWREVLCWLTDVTETPVVLTFMPVGSCAIATLPGKRYTIPEITDLINTGLQNNGRVNYYLIGRERSFTLVPADEKPDPQLFPHLRPADLDRWKWGNTLLAALVLPQMSMPAEDVIPEAKKGLGQFGEVVATPQGILFVDTVANLKRVRQRIDDLERATRRDTLRYTCKFIRAADAEQILKDLLGGPHETYGPPVLPWGRRWKAPAPPKGLTLAVTSDTRTNTVRVTGPADQVAQARTVLAHLEARALTLIVWKGPGLKMYPVPAGTAEALAKALQEEFKSSTAYRTSAAGNNKVLVFATPGEQELTARLLRRLGAKGGKAEKKGTPPKRR